MVFESCKAKAFVCRFPLLVLRWTAAGLVAALFILLVPQNGFAVQPDEILQDQALEVRARAISAELRCVVCQNQSIDDSDAPLARDLRLLVRERLLAGDSDAAVKTYIVDRYGTFVLLSPPFAVNTVLLWVMPLVVLLLALWLGWRMMQRSRIEAGEEAARRQDLSEEERRRLQEMLKDDAS